MNLPELRVVGLTGMPEVGAGDRIGRLIRDAGVGASVRLQEGDLLVVTQKIVSKAEGRLVDLASIDPSPQALDWGAAWERDPRLIEVILRESRRIVRMDRGVMIVETSHGFICANAGVDASNVPEGFAALLPVDPDASAAAIRDEIRELCGVPTGVIVSDTFGRPWREGLVNVALGVAGMAPLVDYRGSRDSGGRVLQSTVIAAADELASAAELVMGKTLRIPVVVIRGFSWGQEAGSGRDLLRAAERDLFR